MVSVGSGRMTLRSMKKIVLPRVDKTLDKAVMGRVKCDALIFGAIYHRRNVEKNSLV